MNNGENSRVISHNIFRDNTQIQQGNVDITNYQGSINISSHHGDVNISAGPPQELKLDYLPDASFDAVGKQYTSGCLQHTREEVLSDIRTWIYCGSEKSIYWLNGMAGTGKSTISLTLAREYYKKKQLGASFFFSRGGGDLASTRKFATTMAVQLAEYSLELQQHIIEASTSNPRVNHLGLYDQWEKLVMEPLSLMDSTTSAPSPLLIIVDALDECDNERDMAMLIECFASAIGAVKNIPLRIFVTSRPDRPVNLGFGSISINAHQDFVLHGIEQSIVDGDLKIYYHHRLTQISERHGLDATITSNEVIQSLVLKSHGLFIYAATACRFINEGGSLAEKRLTDLFTTGPSTSKAEKGLDYMYLTVLEYSFNEQLDPGEIALLQKRFQKVVGSIVVLFDTFTLRGLVAVVGGPRAAAISVLDSLGSVLEVSEEDGKHIDVLHPSFRDFLLDPSRCSNEAFAISVKELHEHLFERCLVVMRHALHKDMCKLKKPGTKTRDISKAQVDACIPLPVQYACSYWIQHLQQCGLHWKKYDSILDFFQTHFLAWLEVLALLGRLSEGMTMLANLQSLLGNVFGEDDPQSSPQDLWKRMKSLVNKKARDATVALRAIVHDAKRFALEYSAIIEEAPLQVYCSVLIFSPEQSLIRQIYQNQIPTWITPFSQRRQTWTLYTQVLWHPDNVESFVFSPNGRILASGCTDGTVWLWDAVTGAKQRVLKDHSNYTGSIAISHKGHLAACRPSDGTVQLWNSITGAAQGVLKHDGVISVAFSLNGSSLAAISHESISLWSIPLWSRARRVKLWEFHGLRFPEDVLFSPNDQHVVYRTQNEIHLLDAETGQNDCVFIKTSKGIKSFKYLAGGHLIGMGTNRAIELYDAKTSTRRWRWRFRVKRGQGLEDIAFSPNDRVLAVAFGFRIELLDVASGHRAHTMGCSTSSPLRQIAFSPDGTFLASSLMDHTIRFWDISLSRLHSATGSDIYSPRPSTTSDCGNFVAFLPLFESSWLRSAKAELCIWETQNMAILLNSLPSNGGHNLFDLLDCESGASAIHITNVGYKHPCDPFKFSPDSKLIAVITIHDSIQIWDTRSRAMVHNLKIPETPHLRMAFSLDSKLMATTAASDQLYIFNLEAAGRLNSLQGDFERIFTMEFLLQDRLIVSKRHGFERPVQIELLDAHTGTILRDIELEFYLDSHYRLHSVSTDGNIVILTSQHRLEVWNLETATLKEVLSGPKGYTVFICFPARRTYV
ncbi:Vegetative incompatibility HET-E-1-like protein [Cladobotryum mycophilum]|uniref:Vegetative incompatibility HET-E-1-like protein n=1 Tax=Cladobotryum mycophilum TaxID=491253 RepID=A0ABR0SPZ6_9HYPO